MGCLSNFPEDLYSRILGGNWLFEWVDFFQVGLENSLYISKIININLKQKNDSYCTFYHFSLLVACHDNFLVVCLCILIFPGIVELKNFFVSCSKGLVKFQISWGHSVLGGTKNFDKVINDQSCKYKLKNS